MPRACRTPCLRQALAEAIPSSAEREEIMRLRAELKRVEQGHNILKKVVAIFSQPPHSLAFISSPSKLRLLSQCGCSAAYSTSAPLAIISAWTGQTARPRLGNRRPPPLFRAMPTATARRLQAELRAKGHAVGRYALRSWLRRHNLRALSTRPHRPRTTVADSAAVVAENMLLGQPAPSVPNRVWVEDITYLPLVGGRWCYLATWRDTCSRRVVGWHLGQQMPTDLVLTALICRLTFARASRCTSGVISTGAKHNLASYPTQTRSIG